MLTPRTEHLIDLALEEDAGLGDVTSRTIFPANHTSKAFISAGHDLVICGLEVAARVFAKVDPASEASRNDGHGLVDIQRQAEIAREIVEGAERQHRQRCRAARKRGGRLPETAVAAANRQNRAGIVAMGLRKSLDCRAHRIR